MTRKGVMAAVLGAGLGLAALVPAAFAAEPITGRWVTAEKDAVIVIAPCGKALCGTIERFLVAPPQGNDQRDINNPDAAKRKRKLLATTPILSAFTQESNLWRGQIYDPKSGKSYRSVVRRKGPMQPFTSSRFGPFCQTQVWRRAS
ncbi:MAG: DUF2147 domain-containing protein [Porphyrobacter sp.]|nr:DUF2147 domain-containing protein [Porphyrobacter sp.]